LKIPRPPVGDREISTDVTWEKKYETGKAKRKREELQGKKGQRGKQKEKRGKKKRQLK
jgi:hypothetical protein